MKSINTLVEDIEHVIRTGEGWTEEISQWFANDVKEKSDEQMRKRSQTQETYLRMSNIGRPDCVLWYMFNRPDIQEKEKDYNVYNIFSFGDMIESWLLALTKAAGHTISSHQAQCEINGIKGSNDAIIDGVMVDVKSASDDNFKKFDRHMLRFNFGGVDRAEEADYHGYLPQLAGYVAANIDNPDLLVKTHAAFLVMNKNNGKIVLDLYNIEDEVKKIPAQIEHKRNVISGYFPGRSYEAVPYKANSKGHMTLPKPCKWCTYRDDCWDGDVRVFRYTNQWVTLVEPIKDPPKKPELIKQPDGSRILVDWFDRDD